MGKAHFACSSNSKTQNPFLDEFHSMNTLLWAFFQMWFMHGGDLAAWGSEDSEVVGWPLYISEMSSSWLTVSVFTFFRNIYVTCTLCFNTLMSYGCHDGFVYESDFQQGLFVSLTRPNTVNTLSELKLFHGFRMLVVFLTIHWVMKKCKNEELDCVQLRHASPQIRVQKKCSSFPQFRTATILFQNTCK